MPKTNEREWEVKHAVMFERIAPMMAKLRAKYPKESNIDGFEPALTSDVAEICLQLEASAIARCAEIALSYRSGIKLPHGGFSATNVDSEVSNQTCEDIATAITSLGK